MTLLLLLAAMAAACWVVVSVRRGSRRARPGNTVEDFHRALDAISDDSKRPQRR